MHECARPPGVRRPCANSHARGAKGGASGGGGIRTHGPGGPGQQLSRLPHSTALPPLRESRDRSRWLSATNTLSPMAARVAQLGGRPALRAGRDRAAGDPRGARRGDRGARPSAGCRVRASGSGHSFTDIALTDGVMVRCDRLDRRARGRRRRGPGQGRGGDRARRAQPPARRARARVREPRRHRPPDARRLDRHRHARHRRALSQRLGADRGGRAGARRRQLARDLRRLRPGRARRGADRARRARGRLRGDGARRCPPSRSTASTARARSTRRSPGSTSSTPPATTSSSTSSRTPDRALSREPAHRRAAAAAPGGARLRPGGDARELGRPARSRSPAAAFRRRIPRLARLAAAGVGRSTKVDR